MKEVIKNIRLSHSRSVYITEKKYCGYGQPGTYSYYISKLYGYEYYTSTLLVI